MSELDERLDTLLGLYANPPGAEVRVVGPSPYSDVAPRLVELRAATYEREMPYLMTGEALALEGALRIDELADHFCAVEPDGTIVGALRVTSRPIELPHLCAQGEELAARRPRHGELSRLVIQRTHRQRLNLLARLFGAMAQSMMRTGECVGLVAVARRAGVRPFGRFGFTPVDDAELALAGRPTADYRVIAATFDEMMAAGASRLRNFERGLASM